MIAICDEQGSITINNLFSGRKVYKLSSKQTMCEISQVKFINPSSPSLYLCATASSGNVIFYTKPLPANEVNHKSVNSGADEYLNQTLIKKNVHQGDLYAIAVSDQFVAVGGMDNKVSYWSAITGAFKSYTKLPRPRKTECNIFIVDLLFLNRHGNFILVLQNNGDMHIVHPASSRIIKSRIISSLVNAYMTTNESYETFLLTANESGHAEIFNIVKESPIFSDAGA